MVQFFLFTGTTGAASTEMTVCRGGAGSHVGGTQGPQGGAVPLPFMCRADSGRVSCLPTLASKIETTLVGSEWDTAIRPGARCYPLRQGLNGGVSL